jgi:hemerythrin superfamily protein
MGDLIGLLMLDHFAINRVTGTRKAFDPVKVESVIHFKAMCHMEIEENAVFPMIESALPEDRSIHDMIKKALSDHIMIRRVGKTLIDIMSNEESNVILQKEESFFKLLAQHELHEDLKVFPAWFYVDSKKKLESIKEAKTVIDQYGFRYYERATDLPEYMVRYFLS